MVGQLKFENCKTCFLLLNTFKLTDSHLRLDVRAQLGTVIDLLNHFLHIANAFSDFRHNFNSNSYFVSQENEIFIKTERARVSFYLKPNQNCFILSVLQFFTCAIRASPRNRIFLNFRPTIKSFQIKING